MKAAHTFFGRFRTKVMLAFISAMAVVCIASGLFLYHYVSDFALGQLRNNLMEIARLASTRVDPEVLLSIPLNPKGAESPAYKKIEQNLHIIQQALPSVKYIYILKKDPLKPDTLRFIVDVDIEEQESVEPAYPGDEYDASFFPDLMKGFHAPSADRFITQDKWGAFLSGYAPIRDKTGATIAVLGVDMTAEDVYKIQADIKRYLKLNLVFGITLSLLLAFFVSGGISRKVKALKEGFQRIAAGDLEHSVPAKGNDELTDLAYFFNKMSVDLKDYIAKLQTTTADKERLLSELNIARDIQRSFLPAHPPVIAGMDIAAMTNPARVVGGDFYDFIPIGEGRYGIVIADVSGKGVPAALFVALSRALIRSNKSLFDSPDMIVKHANSGMIELSRSSMFETLFYGVLDAKKMTFNYANAGHNPPFILSVPQAESVLLKAQTFPIGINLKMEINAKMQALKVGDVIILYTDGVTEAMDKEGEEYGTERLIRVVQSSISMPSEGIVEKINQDIELFASGAEQHDDITIIVLKAL